MPFFEKEIKKLGFGLMRLPQKDGAIDIEQTKVMVDKFMNAGFTYFDTAWAYPGSEDAVRQALVERYPRESFQLATKNAARDFLQKHNVPFEYKTLTEKIINRKGDDICPMEKTVAQIEDTEQGYFALKRKLQEMHK